jgi:hypothetical protein
MKKNSTRNPSVTALSPLFPSIIKSELNFTNHINNNMPTKLKQKQVLFVH